MSVAKTPHDRPSAPEDPDLAVLDRAYATGRRLGAHRHDQGQLLFAASGAMQVSTPRGRWLVPPTRAVWLPPGLEHDVEVLAAIEMRSLYVSRAWLARHAQAARLEAEFVAQVGPLLRELVLALFRPPFDRQRASLIADLALRELAEAPDAATFMPLPLDPRARRVAQAVLDAPGGQRSLDALARQAGASERTISRLFRQETGIAFKAWRQRARVMAGLAALGAETLPLDRLAARLGFSSVSAFGQAVRQVTGSPPGAFRPKRPGRR